MADLERVIILVDIDCFFCQVEEKLDPCLKGKPLAVLQYNVWREGGIIAANYLARKHGVNKGMWRKEAEQKCPTIQFATVPELRGKADLTRYRKAGKQVADVLKTFTSCIERASVDEAYLDITDVVRDRLCNDDYIDPVHIQNTHIFGHKTREFLSCVLENKEVSLNDMRLLIGAVLCEEIRAKVLTETGYECSAGIAHNKLLAKLISSLHKPNKQTILSQNDVQKFLENLPVKKMRSLGGKLGTLIIEELGISCVGELAKLSQEELVQKFNEKTGKWLYGIARGIDPKPVVPHLLEKSIACSKRFPFKNSLNDWDKVEYWIKEIALDLSERLNDDLEMNNRKGRQMIVSFTHEIRKSDVTNSKRLPLMSYDHEKIAQMAIEIVKPACTKVHNVCIKFLSISVSNFETATSNKTSLKSFFRTLNSSEFVSTTPNNHDLIINDKTKTPQTNEISDYDEIEPHKLISDRCADTMQETFKAEEAEHMNTIKIDDVNKKNEPYSFFKAYFANCEQEKNKKLNDASEKSSSSSITLIGDTCGLTKIEGAGAFAEENGSVNHCEANKIYPDVLDTSSNGNIVSTDNLNTYICPECNATVPKVDCTIHRDYHYAMQVRKEEFVLQTASIKTNNLNKLKALPDNARKKKTRKKNATKQINSLDCYLNRSEVYEDTEFCAQCNKKVKVSDLKDHSDYHAAKSLHLEINSIHNNVSTKKKVKSLGTISSFFKSV